MLRVERAGVDGQVDNDGDTRVGREADVAEVLIQFGIDLVRDGIPDVGKEGVDLLPGVF